jgi:multisubunit Na+/H+ antiporter MnhE subunit
LRCFQTVTCFQVVTKFTISLSFFVWLVFNHGLDQAKIIFQFLNSIVWIIKLEKYLKGQEEFMDNLLKVKYVFNAFKYINFHF